MKNFYFLLIVLIVLTIFTYPTMSQKKQSECERKVKELEERIINLEKMNSDLVNLLSNQKVTIPTTNDKKFVIKFFITSEDVNGIDEYRCSEYSRNISSDFYNKYNNYFEKIKSDLGLTYLLMKASDNKYYKHTGFTASTLYDLSVTYSGELGFFETQQEAKVVIANYIPREMTSSVYSIKDEMER